MKVKQTASYVFLFAFIFLVSCKDSVSDSPVITNESAFIHPPINGVDVPSTIYTIVAEEGDTIFHPTGSMLVFPPNAVVDKNGNPIRGKVDIEYREFSDPIDFFIAGIPMDYHENGKDYVFESSGMCEIKATKDRVPVFVNQRNKPQLHLASKNPDTAHNLYVLDTVHRKWVNKGKDEITDIRKLSLNPEAKKPDVGAIQKSVKMQRPLPPQKSSGKMPLIQIQIEPGSVPELMLYNNLQFEIDKRDEHWNSKYSDVLWSDVKLAKSQSPGVYIAAFSNAQQTVSFRVRPVLEGKDYEEALKTFKAKNREYQQLEKARVNKERLAKHEAESAQKRFLLQQKKQLEENNKIERMNLFIEARNREIEKINQVTRQENQWLVSLSVLRTFYIDGFGIWNCDRQFPEQGIQLTPYFTDESGAEIKPQYISVAVKDFNGVFRYRNSRISVRPGKGNMIFGTMNNQLVFLSKDDYLNTNIQPGTTSYTFRMQVHEINGKKDLAARYKEIRDMMDIIP